MSGIQFKNSIYHVFNNDGQKSIFDTISGKSIDVENNTELNAALAEIIKYEDSIKLTFLKNQLRPEIYKFEIHEKGNEYMIEGSMDPDMPELGCTATLRFLTDTEDEGKQKIEQIINNLKEHRPRFFLADSPDSWSWKGRSYDRDVTSLGRIYGTITPEIYDLTYVCNVCVIILPQNTDRSRFYAVYAAEGLCIAADMIILGKPGLTDFTPSN